MASKKSEKKTAKRKVPKIKNRKKKKYTSRKSERGSRSKVTDTQFVQLFRKAGGLYSETQRLIEGELGIQLTRQAIRQRAKRMGTLIDDVAEEMIDTVERGLHDLATDTDPDSKNVRLGAIKFYLNAKAKSRGFIQRHEVQGGDPDKPVRVVVDGGVLHGLRQKMEEVESDDDSD